ncbi:RNA methyltransferase, putative [Plasmodium malariae]|uniref:RNA methyltransferase, putative n=2 Tax=Plasmodium (Plasmodium) TaxID=418103 RepID=A0A1A8W3C2_PLAMA|nr:RNA methyltransferase, putative [Plasmodium malariae]SBS86155.1 RNA methyltransferase, putative [Plasmodium malariae]SCN44676.1 RNA methyltransferase, putative [Plasmodium malariae]
MIRRYVTDKYICIETCFAFKRRICTLLSKDANLVNFKEKNSFSVNQSNNANTLYNDNFTPHWINLNKQEKNKLASEEKEKHKMCNNSECVLYKEYLSISKRSKMMKYIIRLRKKSNFRKKMNAFFVKDSETIVHLSNNNNSLIFEAILSNSKTFLHHFKNKCKKLYYANDDILKYIFHDSPNVKKEKNNDSIAIIKIPPNNLKKFENIKFLLAFDRIRYAYNLGKILSTAYSMNVDFFFYVHNTVDPFNHKVIEVTRGSHFHIPYIFGSYEELENICTQHKLLPIVAHTSGINLTNILKESKHNGVCLILGNESTGPHADILSFAKPISLPMHEMTNSLNVSVAASIFIHYLKNML